MAQIILITILLQSVTSSPDVVEIGQLQRGPRPSVNEFNQILSCGGSCTCAEKCNTCQRKWVGNIYKKSEKIF